MYLAPNTVANTADTASTPMLKQYHSIKARHKDCILFFRLGDFYEMFYDDAKAASEILDLVLTGRGKDAAGRVPMCGIPYHAADAYIARLIKAGQKIAICEQVEDPAEAKGIVRRDVIRVITAGTYLDEASADARYLAVLFPDGKNIGLSFIDPATGTIQTNQYPDFQKVLSLLAKLPLCECVFPDSQKDKMKELFKHPILRMKNISLSSSEDWCFNVEIARKTLCEHFGMHSLKGFGIDEMPAAVAATGALLEYLRAMNKAPLRHIERISLYADEDYVFISPAAQHGLELENFLQTIDQTLTAMGKRKLRFWIYHPLKKTAGILERQSAIKFLKDNPNILQNIKANLNHTPDVEKSISRLSCGYLSPKDILAIRNTLVRLPDIQKAAAPVAAQNARFALDDIPDLRSLLEKAISPGIPLSNYEGKVIQKGYHAELDALRDIQENGREWLRKFQEEEIKRTRINSLKVGFNNVFGYYIEISNANKHLAPSDYIRKQTLVNGERYITPQLKEYEEKILTAQEKILKIENSLLAGIQKEILDHSSALANFCRGIAAFDALYSLAILAQSPHYAAPVINESTVLDIKEGRHPVVERMITGAFVANDTTLDCEDNHLIILTGPNMAGKSTYIRQTALLVIMAQIGSFIPAKSATVGIVDKIFTRIGAHDDIAKGQSTFMVEMSETADILNNLTGRSLVILDEIGRGTSTFDGLSLAWALAEYFQRSKARTLFATHYHELTSLAEQFSGVKNYNVAVKEWKDEIIFLHKIVPGSTDDSYGIYVAKLAGIPHEVISRSRQILTQLELKSNLRDKISPQKPSEEQMNLFSRQDKTLDEIKETIAAIDINNLTPIQALGKLEEIKNKLKT